ncbi:hypothetical protein FRB99_007837 [Tulasnella sp. 403]|nr:hypothetical protein FRB99_007837 [Tulasnella sp. 403]
MTLNTHQRAQHSFATFVPTVHSFPYVELSMSHRPISPPVTPQRTPSPGGGTDYSFTTIHSSEAEAYFREEAGRKFPAGSDHPTTLPMDTAEGNRLRGLHMALKILLGKNHFGPLDDILKPSRVEPHRRRKVLDVYSTPGVWIQEMSVEYPTGVKFVGVDVAPSVLHYPKENVAFEIYNFPRQGFSCDDAYYDAVHARGIIRDVPNLVAEIRRILRSGGIFMFGEMELAMFGADGRNSAECPGINALYTYFKRAVEAQGIRSNGVNEIDQWIEAVGGFRKPVHQMHLFPIGGQWLSPSHSELREVGRLMLQNQQRLAESMKPVLLHYGLSQAQVETIVGNALRDLSNPAVRLYNKYHTVYAIRE